MSNSKHDAARRDRQHHVAAGLIAVGLLGAVACAAVVANEKMLLDPTTACPLHTHPAHTFGLIMDSSDPLGSDNPRRVAASVSGFLDQASRGDLVLVVPVLGEAPNEVTPMFSRCAPAKPEQVSYLTGGNPRLQAKAFTEEFTAPLLASTAKIRAMPSAPHSPIAEVIVALASDRSFRSGKARQIDVLSDGLQNTSGQNAYRRHFRLRPAPTGLLEGTTVKFHLLRNPKAAGVQTEALVEAWRSWVEAAGGRFELDAPWLTGRDAAASSSARAKA